MRTPAVGLLLCVTVLWSCGGGESGTTQPPVTPVPTSVRLSATTVTLRMGETSQLTASVLDQQGRPMSGQAIAWASSDTTKVTVTGVGLTRGVRPGTATLTASSGALAQSATGTVLAPQLVVEPGSATTVSIGAAGGTVSAQAANGARFTLTVPATALLESVDITMTAITSIQNLPAGATLVSAVQLRPDGLTFLSPATLMVDLPSAASATNLVGLRFGDDGSALRLTPIKSAGRRLTLPLSHFSGAGAANTANPPLIPLTAGGTVADDAQNQLVLQEISAQGSGSYDLAAIATIFRTWYTSGVRPRLQNGATDEPFLGPAIAAWAEWRNTILTFQPTIAGALDAALSAQQTEGRELAATALQAAIQRNNATCMAQQDLTAARKVFVWQAVAENHALATSANALDRTTVLNGLCVEVHYTQITMADPLLPLQSATLRVQAGLRFGPGAPVYLANPTVDVRLTATGSTDGTAHNYQTDGTGNAQATFTPTGGTPLVIALHSCVNDPVGIGLTLFDVCQDMTVTRNVQAGVTISPSPTTVTVGGTVQFTAVVAGSTNQAVTWTQTGGSISPTGLYTAGATPGTYQVSAVSVADPTKSATAMVTITAGRTITGDAELVFEGQQAQFADVVEVTGTFFIGGNITSAITLPALQRVGAELVLYGNASSISLPNLKSAGTVRVGAGSAVSKLTSVSMPLLETVIGDVSVYDNPELTSLDVRSLKSARIVSIGTGPIASQGNRIARNPKLTTLNVGPVHTTLDLRITGNDQLTSLANLSTQTVVGRNLFITYNQNLSTALATAFRAAITVVGIVTISGNKP